MGVLDHALAVVFAIGFPLVNTPLYARRQPALRAGDAAVRRREYLETIVWLASMGLASIVVWLLTNRTLGMLGLGWETSWQAITALVAALFLSALLFLQVRGVRRDPSMRAMARKTLEPVREYLPTTRTQIRLFRGVAISAGIGEEIYYRGFLLWYFSQFMSLPWAVVMSSALFGLAHVMHGVQATVRSTVMGFALAGLYLLSGVLWASMLLHTAVDLSSGETGVAAFGSPPQLEQ